VYMCQKLWKLVSSRQSYCKNNQAYFFWPTLYIHLQFTNSLMIDGMMIKLGDVRYDVIST